jgi:AP-4 complex subunit mu-1
MISNFFVLSPRGDTIIAKQYRINDRHGDGKEIGAHERTHTEAFFRKIKFWDEIGSVSEDNDGEDGRTAQIGINGAESNLDGGTATKDNGNKSVTDKSKMKYDAPPVFLMPDGYTYFHIKRNGLIFGASTVRNISPNTVLEVSPIRMTFRF